MRAFIMAFGVLVAAAVAEDYTGPAVEVTSHYDGQAVTEPSVRLSGTVTDDGSGESGVAGITIAGLGASGDTASGSATAYWWRTVPLVAGENRLEIVATDRSENKNQATTYFTIVYLPAEDAVADAPSFVAANKVAPGGVVVSNTVVVSGINVPVEASVSGGSLQVDGGGWLSSAEVLAGQSITLQATAADTYGTSKQVTLKLGSVKSSWMVTTAAAALLPDYAVQKVALSPATPAAGASFMVTVTIKNVGTGPGTGGRLAVVPAVGSLPVYQDLPALAKGRTLAVACTVPAQPVGKQTLTATLTPPNGDSSGVNNSKTFSYSVAAPPNLKVTAVRFSPSVPTAGKKFTAYVSVTNTGGVSAASKAAVWLDYTDGAAPLKTASVGALKTGKKMTLSFTGLVAGEAGTPQAFQVLLDVGGAMVESDETDNLATATFTPK